MDDECFTSNIRYDESYTDNLSAGAAAHGDYGAGTARLVEGRARRAGHQAAPCVSLHRQGMHHGLSGAERQGNTYADCGQRRQRDGGNRHDWRPL